MINIPPQVFSPLFNKDVDLKKIGIRASKLLIISITVFLFNGGMAYLLWPYSDGKNLSTSWVATLDLIFVTIALVSLVPITILLWFAPLALIPKKWLK